MGGTTTTTTWVYEGQTLMSQQVVSGSNSWRVDYLYNENGTPIGGVYRSPATSTSPVFFAIITNSHGDVCELLDANGNAFAAYHYDAWGLPQGSGTYATGIWTQSTSLINVTLAGQIASEQALRYADYVYDPESGLYYCSARYYDPVTRQWTTADSAKADGEESPYQYCSGHPTDQSDPSGEGSVKIDFPRPKHLGKYNWSGYYPLVCGVDAAFAQDHLLDQLAADPILGFARTLDWWAFHMVAGKNPWDFKLAARGGAHGWRDKKYLPFHGKRISPDDFGNIHFGYTGSAIGLNKLELDLGAQGANFFTNTLKDLNWNHPKIKAAIETIKSEFKSDGMIALGVRLFHRYGPMTGTGIHFVRS